MNREEAIKTIVRAAQWLTTSPKTHSGRTTGRMHTIEVSATTHNLHAGFAGVYFGNSTQFHENGHPDQSSSIALVDHADRASSQDYVPVTTIPSADEPRLARNDSQGVNMRILHSFPDEQLVRMANNALRVMREYDQD